MNLHLTGKVQRMNKPRQKGMIVLDWQMINKSSHFAIKLPCHTVVTPEMQVDTLSGKDNVCMDISKFVVCFSNHPISQQCPIAFVVIF